MERNDYLEKSGLMSAASLLFFGESIAAHTALELFLIYGRDHRIEPMDSAVSRILNDNLWLAMRQEREKPLSEEEFFDFKDRIPDILPAHVAMRECLEKGFAIALE